MAPASCTVAPRRAAWLTLALAVMVHGHGRMTVPRARNVGSPKGDQNDLNAGGAGKIHAGGQYRHGLCGNEAGVLQKYNKVGDVQQTYVSGSILEAKIVLTVHHVGFFELELCMDAGNLSESCFMAHRLLREGCECSCPNDTTNSCTECDTCRRWWKPLVKLETNLWVAKIKHKEYKGPVLPCASDIHLGVCARTHYEFTMRFKVPEGLKTSRGVLRWHYLTTNSCVWTGANDEQFWNCADVAISDSHGDVGPELPYDNDALENLKVEDLKPAIRENVLKGVYDGCPVNPAKPWEVVGVGTPDENKDQCGDLVDGRYEKCRRM